jgi:hypothetical protein
MLWSDPDPAEPDSRKGQDKFFGRPPPQNRPNSPHDLAVAVAVFGKFEQKLTIMTAMGQVIEFCSSWL